MSFLKNVLKQKEEAITTYTDFWSWFKKHERSFFKVIEKGDNVERDFFDKMAPKLAQIKEGIFYLAGMCDEGTAELILTPDGAVENIVFVEELVAAAPEMPGWKFTALKPALNIRNVQIKMDGYIFDAEAISFYPSEHSNYPDEIDIVVMHRDFTEENKDIISNGVYIFLDNFLGEIDFVTVVDNISVEAPIRDEQERVPIEKLKDYLIWRQKEFLEKYEGQMHDTEDYDFANYSTQLEGNDKTLIATINTTLLEWDGKASHPWLMTVKIKYNGGEDDGMPDDATYDAMEEFENRIIAQLSDSDGYLNIGRETGDNLREIYFACKEFRKSSKVLHQLVTENARKLDVSYDIYKDKYWQRMERYRTDVLG